MKGKIRKSICLALTSVMTMSAACFAPVENVSTGSVINIYAADAAVQLTESGGWFESAYVKWNAFGNAQDYNVYYRKDSGSYVKIDRELIRQYKDFYRADVLGLTPGDYTIKVVPVVDGQENQTAASETGKLTVTEYVREGFAFSSKSPCGYTTGGYNKDGSVNPQSEIVYVTNENKNSVTINGDSTKGVGINGILAYREKNKIKTPMIIRFIGKVEMPEGVENYMMRFMNTDNITVEGVGNDATIHGWGFTTKRTNNMEFRNLGIMWYGGVGGDGDSLSLDTENKNVWIHNIDFFYGAPGKDSDQAKGDGSIDLKSKTDYITVSYCHFWDSGKSCVAGGVWESKNPDDPEAKIFVTYHHNWFDHSDSRHPRCVAGSVHVYNNYYDGCAKYGIGAAVQSSVFSEGNYYRNVPRPMIIATQGSDVYQSDGTYSDKGTLSGQTGGMIKSCNDYIVGAKRFVDQNTTPDAGQIDAYTVENSSDKVPSTVTAMSGGHSYNNFDTDSTMYSYAVDTPEQAREKVMKSAGRIDGGDFKWTFDAAQDTNSNVIPELQNAITAYQSELVGTNVEVGTVSTTEVTETTTEGSETTTENGDTPTETTTATMPDASDTWNADEAIPSWLNIDGYTKSSNSSDHDVFSSNDAEVAAIANKYLGNANAPISISLKGASTVKVYIAGNNNSAGKGSVAASLDGSSVGTYTMPGRKDETATPFVITTDKGGTLTLTPSYSPLLYKIAISSEGGSQGGEEETKYSVLFTFNNTTDTDTVLIINNTEITVGAGANVSKTMELPKGEYSVMSTVSTLVTDPSTFTVTGEGQTVSVYVEKCEQNVIVTDANGGFINGYASLSDAVNAETTAEGSIISIKPGYYHETLDITKAGLTIQKMKGEEGEAVIYYDNGAYGGSMKGVVRVSGANVTMKDMTLLNNINTSYGSVTAAQTKGTTGAALISDGDNSLFENCKFISVQDTVNTYHYSSGKPLLKQTFNNCVFYGATDFVCGSSEVNYNNCEFRIFTGALTEKEDAYVFAPSQNAKWTVNGGKLINDANSVVQNFYYARPWEDRSDNSQTLDIFGMECDLEMGTKGLMGFGGPTGGGRSHSVNDFKFNVYAGKDINSELVATSNVTNVDIFEMNESPVIKFKNGKDMLLVADFGKNCGQEYVNNILQDVIEVGFVSEANASADKITDTNTIKTTTLYRNISGEGVLETAPVNAGGSSCFGTGVITDTGAARTVTLVPYVKYDAKHNDDTIDINPIYQFGKPVTVTIGY